MGRPHELLREDRGLLSRRFGGTSGVGAPRAAGTRGEVVTAPVGHARRAAASDSLTGLPPDTTGSEADTELILGSGDPRPVDPTHGPVEGDGGELNRVSSALAWMSSPLVLERFAQSLLRNVQVSVQETGIRVQNERAEQAAQDRQKALLESIAKAKDAEGWGVFAQVATRVAAVIAAVALTVAGAFTGGAGVVAAVGLIVVAFGADLGLMLDKAGVDSDVTNAIGIGASIIGTACTLGANSAGTFGSVAAQGAAVAAETAAQTAAETAVGLARSLELTTRIYAAAGRVVSGAYQYEADQASADSKSADVEVDDAQTTADEYVQDAIEFMKSYQRVVARLTRAADAKNEARRVASRRLA